MTVEIETLSRVTRKSNSSPNLLRQVRARVKSAFGKGKRGGGGGLSDQERGGREREEN